MADHATIHFAKTHLSSLIARAEAGEEIVLARGKTPVAKLVPFKPVETRPEKKRELGWLAGQVWMDEGFDDPMTDDELREWGIID